MANHQGTMAIALLDILGFRALMAEMEPAALYEATLGEFSTMIERSISGVHWTPNPLHAVAFSDTLFLWLEPGPVGEGKLDGFAAVQDMVLAVRGLIARGMRRHISLRGAIAYGNCFIANEPAAFIGKPILDAYELEQRQQWAGAALCKSAEEQLGNLESMAREPFRPVVRYAVPVKENKTENLLAVKWPYAFDLPHPTAAMRPANDDAPESLRIDVREKIKNTSDFYDRFKSQFQPHIDKEGALVIGEFVVPSDKT